MKEDAELLRRYAAEGDEDAFRELVSRHVALVYSSALRQLNGDAHLAADVAQVVFSDLARKARSLANHRVLAGWLFTSTRFAVGKIVRTEQRRRAREKEAQLMQELSEDSAAHLDWDRVRAVLDDALSGLADRDREAILLRYFEHLDYREIGARLHLADNTARMRVDRALDTLRAGLQRRGVTSTSVALAAALATEAVTAAPAGLAASISGVALAGGGAVSLWVAFMSMSKLQVGIAGALALAGATGFVIEARTTAALREEVAAMQQQNAAAESVRQENLQLARVVAETEALRADSAEYARLGVEATDLNRRLNAVTARQQTVAAARQAAAQTFDVSKLDQLPRPRLRPPPHYPFELRRAGITGEVTVDFIVDASGNVQKAVAVKSTRPEFEAAAVEAIGAWKFEAGMKGGRAVNTHMQVPIVFSLNNADAKTGDPVPVPFAAPAPKA